MDESDGSRSTKESSRSRNSHSSRRNQQIASAANYHAQQQVASNTAANANIRYQEQSPGKSAQRTPVKRTCKRCFETLNNGTNQSPSMERFISAYHSNYLQYITKIIDYVRKLGWYGLAGQGRQASGDTEAQNGTTSRPRSRTSKTIRRYQRPHQILVGHSQFPNMKTAT
jgi:hypothetical protein